MDIIEKDIKDIKPYKMNAKKHDQAQIDNVAQSIKQYGVIQPIVVDDTGEIIIGHCRYMAEKQIGMKSVPCIVLSGLSDEKKKKLRIIGNKTNESPWDTENITDLDFSDYDIDFSTEMPDFEGFDGQGDGGGSYMATGERLRVVIGATMFDIEDPDHSLYDASRNADEDTIKDVVIKMLKSEG